MKKDEKEEWDAYVHDGSQGPDHIILVVNIIARDAVGDVGEQLGEVGHLEELICGDELECLHTVRLQGRRGHAVGGGTTGQLENLGHGSTIEVGEAIGERI